MPESVVLHSRATKMLGSVTQACRTLLSGDEKCGFRCRRVPFILTSFCPTPTGNKNGRKCRLNVSCRTLGRRKCVTVLPKRVVLHSRATKSMGFVAEESPSSLRHSALHPRATKKDGSVTQACRAALSGDENVRKCCLSLSYFTLGRRKVWVSLPKSPLHPYVILSCTFGQRKRTEVSPERVVLHSRAMKMYGSVAQACRAALLGNENG